MKESQSGFFERLFCLSLGLFSLALVIWLRILNIQKPWDDVLSPNPDTLLYQPFYLILEICHIKNILIYLGHFRRVFGTGVGPNKRPSEDGTEKWHYSGIRKKDATNSPIKLPTPTPVIQTASVTPAAVRVVNNATTTTAPAAEGSILKAQLSAPLRSASSSPIRNANQQQVNIFFAYCLY